MFVYLAGEQGTPFSDGQGDLLFILYNSMQQAGQLKHFEQLAGKLLASKKSKRCLCSSRV
jgi:hypothetical protein